MLPSTWYYGSNCITRLGLVTWSDDVYITWQNDATEQKWGPFGHTRVPLYTLLHHMIRTLKNGVDYPSINLRTSGIPTTNDPHIVPFAQQGSPRQGKWLIGVFLFLLLPLAIGCANLGELNICGIPVSKSVIYGLYNVVTVYIVGCIWLLWLNGITNSPPWSMFVQITFKIPPKKRGLSRSLPRSLPRPWISPIYIYNYIYILIIYIYHDLPQGTVNPPR